MPTGILAVMMQGVVMNTLKLGHEMVVSSIKIVMKEVFIPPLLLS